MKTILNWRRHHYAARVSIFLIMMAFIAGMVGCADGGPVPTPSPEIYDWYDLDDIRNGLAGSYTLMNDLDSTTAGYAALAGPAANGGKGWQPIGTAAEPFTGAFNGQSEHDYEIRDLFIKRPHETHVGLFGYVNGGTIEAVHMLDFTVTGEYMVYVGSLVGYNLGGSVSQSLSVGTVNSLAAVGVGGMMGCNWGTVTVCCFTGEVTGPGVVSVGGLVGINAYGATVSESCSSKSLSDPMLVEGWVAVGGLVGVNAGNVGNSSWSDSNVVGNFAVGGLVGVNDGYVSESSFTGDVVQGDRPVGGLVGANNGTVTESSAKGGVVKGEQSVGGLMGSNVGSVSKCCSTGNVTGNLNVGGLLGYNGVGGTVSDSYSRAGTTGVTNVGGLVGNNYEGYVYTSYSMGPVFPWGPGPIPTVGGLVGCGDISDVHYCYWDTETSTHDYSPGGGTGRTTAEMRDIDTYLPEWNIVAVKGLLSRNPSYIWNIVNGITYPFLSWEPAS